MKRFRFILHGRLPIMKKKKIDAVKTVRLIRDRLYQETKKMSRAEIIRFYRSRAAAAHDSLKMHRRAA